MLGEAPNNSPGNTKLTKSEEISLTPSTRNETTVRLDHVGAGPVDSVTAKSPETQYSQDIRSSSRQGSFLVKFFII